MKVSTRGRYGLRAMLELARCSGESPVLMSTLAEREDISRKYLHALLTALKSAGLVRSVRGAGGGFVLSKDPAETRLSEILRAVEGPLSLVDCVADRRACDRSNRCVARGVWQDLSDAIESMLDSITLEDLVARQGEGSSKRCRNRKARPAVQKKTVSRRCGKSRARALQSKDGKSTRSPMASRGRGKRVNKR